jgi:hypothetical protein
MEMQLAGYVKPIMHQIILTRIRPIPPFDSPLVSLSPQAANPSGKKIFEWGIRILKKLTFPIVDSRLRCGAVSAVGFVDSICFVPPL